MTKTILPPYMEQNDKVILFDGVCKLCNNWSQFIIAKDRHYTFKLCSVQSLEGQAILTHFGFSTEVFDTMLLVEGNECFKQSEAFLRVMSQLEAPWKFFAVLGIVPARLRNWLYDRIAFNRYTLFGRYNQCMLPAPDHEKRFLHDK